MIRRPMNILLCNSVNPRTWGGGEKWFIKAAGGLQARGHRVLISGRENSRFLQEAHKAGLPTRGVHIRLDYGWGSLRDISRLIRQEGIERVLVNVNKDARTFGVAARLSRVPLVAARHGARVFRDRLRDRLTSLFLDRILVNNLALARTYAEYRWLPREKIIYLPNGVSAPEVQAPADLRRTFRLPAAGPVILAAGRLSPEKGFDLLLEALGNLRETHSFSLVLAGEGACAAELEGLLRRKGLEKRARMAGYLEDVPSILSGADLLVLPSRHEGMPNIVLEAMAAGVAVVATRVGGMNELIADESEGWLVDPGSPGQLGAAISDALKSEAERRRRAQRGREKALRRFSFETMLDNLEDALELTKC